VLALRYRLSERQKQAIRLAGEKGTFGIQDFEQVCSDVTKGLAQWRNPIRRLQADVTARVEGTGGKGGLAGAGATRNLSYFTGGRGLTWVFATFRDMVLRHRGWDWFKPLFIGRF